MEKLTETFIGGRLNNFCLWAFSEKIVSIFTINKLHIMFLRNLSNVLLHLLWLFTKALVDTFSFSCIHIIRRSCRLRGLNHFYCNCILYNILYHRVASTWLIVPAKHILALRSAADRMLFGCISFIKQDTAVHINSNRLALVSGTVILFSHFAHCTILPLQWLSVWFTHTYL